MKNLALSRSGTYPVQNSRSKWHQLSKRLDGLSPVKLVLQAIDLHRPPEARDEPEEQEPNDVRMPAAQLTTAAVAGCGKP